MFYQGNFLRQKREALGLTVRKLGKAVKVSYSLINKFEIGSRRPSGIVLQRLRKELCLTYEEFKILRKENYSYNSFFTARKGGELIKWKIIEVIPEFKSIYRIM